MAWHWKVLLGISFGILAASMPLPATPSNITLPSTITNHDESSLLCKPTTVFTVLSFLVVNYLAHAATTQAWPGENLLSKTLMVLLAFLFPGSGVARGLNNIFRGILVRTYYQESGQDDLHTAAAAGAICTVVRTGQWRPAAGQTINGVQISDSDDLEFYTPPCLRTVVPIWVWIDDLPTSSVVFQRLRSIRGASKSLPKGYAYALVPPTAVISPLHTVMIPIEPSVNYSKILVTILQTLYASYTLYKARGDQIRQFGYAAFGLTVTPYIVMSLVNLIGSLLLPSYSSLFVVRSEVMDELELRHGRWFNEIVGKLVPVSEPVESGRDPAIHVPTCAPFQCTRLPPLLPLWLQSIPWLQSIVGHINCCWVVDRYRVFDRYRVGSRPENTITLLRGLERILNMIPCFILDVGAPLAIVGAISHFDEGNSTRAQRSWTMSWFVFGVYIGTACGLFNIVEFLNAAVPPAEIAWSPRKQLFYDYAVTIFPFLLYGVPAYGGMVVVIQMIVAYGDCTLF